MRFLTLRSQPFFYSDSNKQTKRCHSFTWWSIYTVAYRSHTHPSHSQISRLLVLFPPQCHQRVCVVGHLLDLHVPMRYRHSRSLFLIRLSLTTSTKYYDFSLLDVSKGFRLVRVTSGFPPWVCRVLTHTFSTRGLRLLTHRFPTPIMGSQVSELVYYEETKRELKRILV